MFTSSSSGLGGDVSAQFPKTGTYHRWIAQHLGGQPVADALTRMAGDANRRLWP
jgi:hypothetical protein